MSGRSASPVSEPPGRGRGASAGPAPWWAYGLWVGVGVLFGLGLAAILTIGVLLLAAGVVLAAVALSRRAARNASAIAVVCGVGAVPLYLAWLNRGGPGNVCHVEQASEICIQEWSPWPFLAVGIVIVVAGLYLARAAARERRHPSR